MFSKSVQTNTLENSRETAELNGKTAASKDNKVGNIHLLSIVYSSPLVKADKRERVYLQVQQCFAKFKASRGNLSLNSFLKRGGDK